MYAFFFVFSPPLFNIICLTRGTLYVLTYYIDLAPCAESDFTCADMSCIPLSRACDGRADCPSAEDERNCTKHGNNNNNNNHFFFFFCFSSRSSLARAFKFFLIITLFLY